jgi:hypothetical protein
MPIDRTSGQPGLRPAARLYLAVGRVKWERGRAYPTSCGYEVADVAMGSVGVDLGRGVAYRLNADLCDLRCAQRGQLASFELGHGGRPGAKLKTA